MHEIREFGLDDLERVKVIISMNWFQSEFGETKENIIDDFVSRYFRRSGHIFVYSLDEKVVGFISGCSKGEIPNPDSGYFDDLLYSADDKLSGSERGRRYLADYNEFDRVSKEMVDCIEGCDMECILFSVDPNHQGSGIGKKLMDRLTEYYGSLGSKKMFLITSDRCDVDFYKHNGYTLDGKEHAMFLDSKNDIFVFSRKI